MRRYQKTQRELNQMSAVEQFQNQLLFKLYGLRQNVLGKEARSLGNSTANRVIASTIAEIMEYVEQYKEKVI